MNPEQKSSKFPLFISTGIGAAIGAILGIIAYNQNWLG
ncbi:hypothetical protein ABID49_000319 [Bhargavaea ullalensis]|uniref:Uncharacterized protein n=1 Tax=Bhargavaea ullalensis TaxID=1265685 RepID=A0ABV2G835_9BACL